MDEDLSNSVIDTSQSPEPNIAEGQVTREPIKKRNKKRTILSLILLTCLLVVSGVLWNKYKITDTSGNKATSTNYSVQFFGRAIPQVDCSQVKQWAKDTKLL